MKILSEIYGSDNFSNRKAQVTVDENGDYGVKYIIDGREEYRFFPDHSVHYAEDAAENWVSGIINPKDLEVVY
jgi:hypothetical protein